MTVQFAPERVTSLPRNARPVSPEYAGLRLLCEEVRWGGGSAHIPRFTAHQYDELTIRYHREISRRLRVPRVKELRRYLETLP
jgi:hypothetical protein